MKFSFERYKGGGAKILKDNVKEIRILGPHRVRFVLKEPWPDFPAFYGTLATSAGWIVPKRYIERVGEDGFRKAPVGAGPYKFVSFTPGIELVSSGLSHRARAARGGHPGQRDPRLLHVPVRGSQAQAALTPGAGAMV